MPVFTSASFDDHEEVVFCRNAAAGLSAIIAIHDRTLGPAVGGCRMWPYRSDSEALEDVLRLSRGMTYKSAMAGLALGGGKSVIIGNPKTDKSPALFHALGEFIESLGGRYWGAEDVGLNVADLETVAYKTRFVAGLSSGQAASGDPSPFTAYGVFQGIRAAVKHLLQRDELEGLRVAVQGLGSVGYHLCQYLHAAGVQLYITDINQEHVQRALNHFSGATYLEPDMIYAQDVDVFSPCALGAVLNEKTIPMIRAKIIAGGANNQLAEERDGLALVQRGIVYAPDYVINAGGIINVESEVLGNYNRDRIMERVTAIYATLLEIFERSRLQQRPTNIVSDEIARQRILSNKSVS